MNVVGQIADLIREETGIVLPATREAAITAAVARAAPGLDPAAFLRAASGPQGDRGLVHRLIDEVTIQETAFVRDRAQFDEIGWHGLLEADVAAGSRTIRVWSAGCASGAWNPRCASATLTGRPTAATWSATACARWCGSAGTTLSAIRSRRWVSPTST
jgi:hypothetical protein